jgi:hypothetical protein
MQRQALTFLVCVLLLIGAGEASAQMGQPWTERVYFNLNGGFASGSESGLEDARTFRIFDEDGAVTARTNVDSAGLIDISTGVRVWRNVSVGIGFHRGSSGTDGVYSGTIPNPLFFNRSRSFAGGVNGLERTEQAVHLQFGYMLRLTDKIDVHVLVGPSFFRVQQDVISAFDATEGDIPFSSVTVGAGTAERSDSTVGANAGVDIGYRIMEMGGMKLGGGLFIRYAGASADIPMLDNVFGIPLTPNVVKSDAGGLQFGIGARLRF